MAYSIAVPAYNEADTVGVLLRRLVEVAPPGLAEIVVADSLSSDDTAAVVGRFTEADRRVRLVAATVPGKPAAWNALVAEVRSDTVVFFDADVTPTQACVPALLGTLDREGVIVAGGRRVPRTDRGGDRLARFLHDPVIETCLAGPGYAVRLSALRGRMAELGFDSMPDVFCDDNWILSLLRRGEFAVVDDATVEIDMSSRAAQRMVSARRRVVAHEVHTVRPEIGAYLDADHPEALRPLAQARHVARGPYPFRRKARWFAAGFAKIVADLAMPVGSLSDDLIDGYERGASRLLRNEASTSPRPGRSHSTVMIRSATTADAVAYARLENLAAGGGTRRLHGRRWPSAIEREFRAGVTRHGCDHVICAERDGEVVGVAAVVAHHRWRADAPAGLRGRVVQAWRRRADGRPPSSTLPGEVTLATLAVDARARRDGVGSRLLADGVDRARALGASAMVLDVATDNDAARGLYRKAGFVGLRGSRTASSVVMMKPLHRTAERRLGWHGEYHRDGFVGCTEALDDPTLCGELAEEADRFESSAAHAVQHGRATVPYFFTPSIERVATDPAILDVIQAVLRTDQWVVWGPNTRRATPNDAARWHVDLESWYWPSVTVAIGLSGCSPDAATNFLPGTAGLAVTPSAAGDDADDRAVGALAARLGATSAPRRLEGLADGRFGVFDARTWHRGDPTTAQGRTMLFLHYQRADAQRVPTMVDHQRHVWSRSASPYRSFGHRASTTVARPPAREWARRLDHVVRR